MDQDDPFSPKSSSRRSRSTRGGLRKHSEIDHVVVHDSFDLNHPGGKSKAGDGCYVSTTVNNKRYYGVLVEQGALKAASMLHFEAEAMERELDAKVDALQISVKTENGEPDLVSSEPSSKKIKVDAIHGSPPIAVPVQKYRIRAGNGHGAIVARTLVATYIDVETAAEDDEEKRELIEACCKGGGGFAGSYYYQFEKQHRVLEASKKSTLSHPNGIRLSLGLDAFLRSVELPSWFPLSNLQIDQSKVLTLLNLKRDNNGHAVPLERHGIHSAIPQAKLFQTHHREFYKVCVVGGGISGLSCCEEIFRECDREGIPVHVTLVEGRKRLGGRLRTDAASFTSEDGSSKFPVDLGASWIHGIEMNPLTSLAKEAEVDFVVSSEDVHMFHERMRQVDETQDFQAGELFDKLLDLAVSEYSTQWHDTHSKKSDDCWRETCGTDLQPPVRWHASVLGDDPRPSPVVATETPSHRQSHDVSVDCAVGKAIASHKLAQFARSMPAERRMLLWNLKNVEYALGANLSDLSMRYWDIDERHAFQGDHVILRQGYSAIIDYMYKRLRSRGDRFKCELDFSVAHIEYARKATTVQAAIHSGPRRFVKFCDTCRVSAHDGREEMSDFVVSCLPLGVLKDSVAKNRSDSVTFTPNLPVSKRDSIASVGFGLLNKVYLQFESPFWRRSDLLPDGKTLFGNATSLHPHHYMFFDVGRSLGVDHNCPAILMSLISGREAVECEFLTDEDVISQVLQVLQAIFTDELVLKPLAWKVTRWGKDRFSRGSYTFLPPGTTDQDFQILQSPINGNGDSLMLEESEIMRVFFAGEHTTALHPSMAHGALLSGVRAAKQLVSSMVLKTEEEQIDRLVPLPLFRLTHPKTTLTCHLCRKSGTTVREGSLLVFRRGNRHTLVHNCCAENSPEVEVFEGQWKSVLRAVNRARTVSCEICGLKGASIMCDHEGCSRSYHFSCGEDTGWRFEQEGKEFMCDLHRNEARPVECVRVSERYYSSVVRGGDVSCAFCGQSSIDDEMLFFERRGKFLCAHLKCAKFCNVVDLGEDTSSRVEHDFRNIFTALDRAQTCKFCGAGGAAVVCSFPGCSTHTHVPCMEKHFSCVYEKSTDFRCPYHSGQQPPIERNNTTDNHVSVDTDSDVDKEGASGMKHEDESRVLDLDTDVYVLHSSEPVYSHEVLLTRIKRLSTASKWNVDLGVSCLLRDGATQNSETRLKAYLSLSMQRSASFDDVKDGDIVKSINGWEIGSNGFDTLSKVLNRINQEVEVVLEIYRRV